MATATETQQANGSGLADVAKIRDILFGEQADQIDERIIMLESAVNSLRQENKRLRQALEAEVTSRGEAGNILTEALQREANDIRGEIKHSNSFMKKQLMQQDKTQEERLGKLLNVFGEHLVAQQIAFEQEVADFQTILHKRQEVQLKMSNALLESLNALK